MAESRNIAKVRIFGSEFSLESTEPEEYIQKVAIQVDRCMKNIYKTDDKLSTMLVAVLAAVNFCDDHLKISVLVDKLRSQIVEYATEETRLNSVISENSKKLAEKDAIIAKKDRELEEQKREIERLKNPSENKKFTRQY